MAAPTHEDAMLMVQLMQWGTSLGLEDAFQHIMAEGFDPEAVDPRDPLIQRILNFGETIGAFVKNGVLSRELVDDLFWTEGTWAKVGPAALKMREEAGSDKLYEHMEALATNG